jgi:hypothetical protein
MNFRFTLAGCLCGFLLGNLIAAEPHSTPIEALRSVGSEGQGNTAASEAWAALTEKKDPTSITELLRAMDGASPVARNWISTAIDQIASDNRSNADAGLKSLFGSFVLDLQQDPYARELALNWLDRLAPDIVDRMISGLVSDPSAKIRKRAVQKWIDRADKSKADGNQEEAALLYRQALVFCRDIEQTQSLQKSLEDYGVPVDLVHQFGFLTNWMVVGPFHNDERSGYATVFPPETELDLKAEYDGKIGATTWKPYSTEDALGMVTFNDAYDPFKEVTGYAYTEFYTDNPRQVELRLGSQNAWKVWLNGEYVFGRDEYHRGREIDQYTMPVRLKAGKNTLLVKVCQNEQRESWTQEWDFQIRVCDSTGTAIHSSKQVQF